MPQLSGHAGGMRYNTVPVHTLNSDTDSLYTDSSRSPLWSTSSMNSASTDASSFVSDYHGHTKFPSPSAISGSSRGSSSDFPPALPPAPISAPAVRHHQYRSDSRLYPYGYAPEHVDQWTTASAAAAGAVAGPSRVTTAAPNTEFAEERRQKRRQRSKHVRIADYDSDEDGFDENGEREEDIFSGMSSSASSSENRYRPDTQVQLVQQSKHQHDLLPRSDGNHVLYHTWQSTSFDRQPDIQARYRGDNQSSIPHGYTVAELSNKLDEVLRPEGQIQRQMVPSMSEHFLSQAEGLPWTSHGRNNKPIAHGHPYHTNIPMQSTHFENMQSIAHVDDQIHRPFSHHAVIHPQQVKLQSLGPSHQHQHQAKMSGTSHVKSSSWPSPETSMQRSWSGDSSSSVPRTHETRGDSQRRASVSTPTQYWSPTRPSHGDGAKNGRIGSRTMPSTNAQSNGYKQPTSEKRYERWVPPTAETTEKAHPQPNRRKRIVVQAPMSRASDAAAKLEESKKSTSC